MNEKQIKEMREQAEQAVSDMPNSELKIKAFEVILGHLLGSSGNGSKETVKAPSKKIDRADAAVTVGGRILSLKNQGFFDTQRSISDIQAELAAHGWHYALSNLSGKLQGLVQSRELRRMKVSNGSRDVWKYSKP